MIDNSWLLYTAFALAWACALLPIFWRPSR